jgi:ComEC/Rec2-related protein
MSSLEPSSSQADDPHLHHSTYSLREPWRKAAFNLLVRGLARPLLLPAIGFASGCAAIGLRSAPVWPGLAVAVLATAILWRAGANRLLLAAALVAIGLGIGLSRAAIASRQAALEELPVPRLCDLTGIVATEPTLRPYSASFLVDASSIRIGAGPQIALAERVSVMVSGRAIGEARGLDAGDAVDLDGVLDRPEGERNGGGFSQQQWLAVQGVSAELRVKRPGGVAVSARDQGSWLARLAGRMRKRSERIFANGLTPADAAAASAIFLGDKSDLPPAFSSAFAATGTVHLLATAGLHIGILVMVLQLVMRLLTIPRKSSALLGIAMVWLYAGMAGGRPAVIRAAFVATIYFGALILERIPDLLSAVALCALVILWQAPREVLDPGFQLTFVTVLGIVALMPALMEVFSGILSTLKTGWRDRALARFIEVECLSASAQASAAPLVAVYFNLVTIYGLSANLIACPLMFLLMPCALITLLAGAIWLPAGITLAHFVLTPILRLVVGIVAAVAQLPHCALPIPSPSWSAVACYYAILFGVSFAYQTIANRRPSQNRGGGAASVDSSIGNATKPADRNPEIKS